MCKNNSSFTYVHNIYLALLSQNKSVKKKHTLTLIWNLLEELRKDGKEVFTISSIGKELEKRKIGIKTQSIYNSTGNDYRKLITAYANALINISTKKNKIKTQIDQALDQIQDSGIRGIIKQHIEIAKKIERENDFLRASYKHLSFDEDIKIPNSKPNYSYANSIESTELIKDTLEIPSRYLSSLQKGIDDNRIMERGLEIKPNGSIYMNKMELFRACKIFCVNGYTAQRRAYGHSQRSA